MENCGFSELGREEGRGKILGRRVSGGSPGSGVFGVWGKRESPGRRRDRQCPAHPRKSLSWPRAAGPVQQVNWLCLRGDLWAPGSVDPP